MMGKPQKKFIAENNFQVGVDKIFQSKDIWLDVDEETTASSNWIDRNLKLRMCLL